MAQRMRIQFGMRAALLLMLYFGFAIIFWQIYVLKLQRIDWDGVHLHLTDIACTELKYLRSLIFIRGFRRPRLGLFGYRRSVLSLTWWAVGILLLPFAVQFRLLTRRDHSKGKQPQ